jgi:membrane-bound lytic murein transglycosylase D
MTARRSPFLWSLGLLALVLLELAGCATTRQPAFRTTLLPAAVEPPPRIVLAAAPPDLEPTPYAYEMPGFLNGPLRPLPGPSIVEPLLRNSEARFQAGRRLFQAGEMEAARREFDRAIDILLSAPEVATGRQDLQRRLAELVEAIHRYDVSGLGAAEPDSGPVFDKPPLEEMPEPTFPIDPKLRNQVAEELKATASQLPLELNDEVLRYINFFSSGRGKKILEYGLRRAGRYRTLIRRIFDEEGIPQELIHLAQAESGFSPRAVSRRRASGMWQFVLSRGQEYGLVRTKATDDRLDPEKATRAAARHLRDLYTQFGDWYLAMAAYNCGPITVQRAVERTGYADIWELRRRNVLPRETASYIPVILAMAIMAKNPAHYGLDMTGADRPLEYSTVELDAPAHLDLIADITEHPVSEIRELNPALLTNVAPAGYFFHLPAGTDAAVVSALELIPPSRRTAWRLHRVVEGDTLEGIARRYRTTRVEIAAVNSSAAADAEPGSLLIVPAPPPPQPARRVSRVSKTAARKPGSATAASRPKTGSPSPSSAAAGKKPQAGTSKTALLASKKGATGRSSGTAR